MSDVEEAEKAVRPFRWHEPETIRVALITSLIAFVVALVSGVASLYAAWTAAANRDRELDLKFVEIGIAILRTDPKEENTAKLREWAIDVIDLYAPKERKFTTQEKAEMLGKAVKATGYYDDSWTDTSFGGGGTSPPGSKKSAPSKPSK